MSVERFSIALVPALAVAIIAGFILATPDPLPRLYCNGYYDSAPAFNAMVSNKPYRDCAGFQKMQRGNVVKIPDGRFYIGFAISLPSNKSLQSQSHNGPRT